HDRLGLAVKAAQEGADYIALGRFFSSLTKPNAPPCSLDTLREIRQKVSLPIVAIGGITIDNAPQVIRAGANMVAVIHGLFGSEDIRASALAFADLF
ncbi:MAG TPA: thiamine phosphate synthase, partial [Pseudomonadales bacterium]|nr:thiamine phosphate synthase [Pseudomonadales bacterium]